MTHLTSHDSPPSNLPHKRPFKACDACYKRKVTSQRSFIPSYHVSILHTDIYVRQTYWSRPYQSRYNAILQVHNVTGAVIITFPVHSSDPSDGLGKWKDLPKRSKSDSYPLQGYLVLFITEIENLPAHLPGFPRINITRTNFQRETLQHMMVWFKLWIIIVQVWPFVTDNIVVSLPCSSVLTRGANAEYLNAEFLTSSPVTNNTAQYTSVKSSKDSCNSLCPVPQVPRHQHFSNSLQFAVPNEPWTCGPSQLNQRNFTPIPAHQIEGLPDWCIVQECLDAFESSHLRLVIPAVDPLLFRQTIKTVYQNPLPGSFPVPASALASIFTFLHFFYTLRFGPISSLSVDEGGYADKALSLFPSVIREGATLDGLQYFVMNVFLRPLSGNTESVRDYLSHAVKFLFQLGGHGISHSAGLGEHLRNLFWLCYTIDKDLALRTQQPPLINDSLCSLSLSPEYVQRFQAKQGSPHANGQLFEGSIFPVDIRLSVFKSKAYAALFSEQGRKKPVLDLLRDIRELDEELEEWRASLPSEWKITVLFHPPRVSEISENPGLLILRLHYHNCMTIIHRVSDRFKGVMPLCRQLQGCIHSSFMLSLEASRSIFLYIQMVGRMIPADSLG